MRNKKQPIIFLFMFKLLFLTFILLIMSIFYRVVSNYDTRIDTHYIFWFIPILKTKMKI